jgi:Ca-activated chloride channel family protein
VEVTTIETRIASYGGTVRFQFPIALWGLAAVGLLATLVALVERRRRRVAAGFAMPQTVPFAVPRPLGWRGVGPTAGLLVAVTALVVAAARPFATLEVPVERATVLLVVDVSNSMLEDDVNPTRLGAARAAARSFIDRLPPTFKVGAVAFADAARVLASPTEDREAVLRPLEQIRTTQGTVIGDGLDRALDVLERDRRRASGEPATVVVLSDGRDTGSRVSPVEAAARAGAAGIPVHVVALGDADATTASASDEGPRPPDIRTLSAIADGAGGKAFTAATEETLTAIYEALATRLSVERRSVDLTAGFVSVATVIAIVAAAASLLWIRRIP